MRLLSFGHEILRHYSPSNARLLVTHHGMKNPIYNIQYPIACQVAYTRQLGGSLHASTYPHDSVYKQSSQLLFSIDEQ
jgi:hypothetical protein